MNNKIDIRYPLQIYSINRPKKTLGVEAELHSPILEDGDTPLSMHCGFSRFKFTLIEINDQKKFYPFANIPAREIDYIHKKTEIALTNLTLGEKLEMRIEEEKPLSSAYTVQLRIGSFKGKTPAAILMEDSSNEENLTKTKNFLLERAEAYPLNKTQAQAIEEALNLFKLGKLNSQTVNNQVLKDNIIEIYNATLKPLKSKKNNEGNWLVYGIKILCNPSKRHPFYIEISNCYAPVNKDKNGILNVQMSKAKDQTRCCLDMTEIEWYSLITRAKKTLDLFEMITFKNQYNTAIQNTWHYKNKDNY